MKVWHARTVAPRALSHKVNTAMKPGTMTVCPQTKQLLVRTGDGFLDLKVVQPALYYIVDAWSFKGMALVKEGEVLE